MLGHESKHLVGDNVIDYHLSAHKYYENHLFKLIILRRFNLKQKHSCFKWENLLLKHTKLFFFRSRLNWILLPTYFSLSN